MNNYYEVWPVIIWAIICIIAIIAIMYKTAKKEDPSDLTPTRKIKSR